MSPRRPAEPAEGSLERFYERWATPLVIDLWFSAQAQSQRPSVLGTSKGLHHPSPVQPHGAQQGPRSCRQLRAAEPGWLQPGGRGGLALGSPARCSPSTASTPRLRPACWARSRSWRALEPHPQIPLRAGHCKRLQKGEEISRDVFEIVTKMLDS